VTRRRLRSSVPVLIALTAIAIAGRWWLTTRAARTPLGVLLITLDTVRADRLSPYGFMNVSLPNLERLAREGVVFDQATSVAPLTLPAHTTLLTGLLPPHHAVRDNADTPLADTFTTLAETLLAHGFRTGAAVGSAVLDPRRGLKQGFEQYFGFNEPNSDAPGNGQRRADEVVNDAIRWLDTIAEHRFLLWTHLYDAHRPYDPPEPFRTTYGHNPYVGEIAFADSQIGRLLEALDTRSLLDRTVVIVVGDHGESLGAHGERDHGIFVYEDTLRVPLMVRAPGLGASRIAEVVRLADVMPTILDLLNIPSPPVDGTSLVELMRGRLQGLNLVAYSESLYPARLGWSSLRALRDGRFKLIDAPRPELYDLAEDPFEEHNIYDTRRALAAEMTTRVSAIAQGSNPVPGQDRHAVTPELRAQLGALGYVSSAAAEGQGDTARPDPKDCIGSYTGGASGRPGLDCGPSRVTDELLFR